MHQSAKHISDERYSRFHQNPSSCSNILVTEPRRDGSYNSLLDMKETERRDHTDRGLDHMSSIQPYHKKYYKEDRVSDERVRSHLHNKIESSSYSQISASPNRHPLRYRPERKQVDDLDTSFENERKLYESGPSSRFNSRARSKTPPYKIAKSPMRDYANNQPQPRPVTGMIII